MDLLLVMAVLPAAWLLRYVYRLDPIEKESPRLLMSLLLFGALACVPAVLLESFGMEVLLKDAPPMSYATLLVENFLVIALSEEACKMFFMRLKTWQHHEYNYVFDGIVYGVFVSLGFAILENIGYVFSFGMSTAVVRAVTAIPGHAVFGVFMGYFYGLEKQAHASGRSGLRILFAICSLLVPVLCHGFYDFCASVYNVEFTIIFFVFLIALIVVAALLARHMAAKAHPVVPAPTYPPPSSYPPPPTYPPTTMP